MKNHTQNAMEKLFPDSFLQNQHWGYLRINSLKFYKACLHCMPRWRPSKSTETKMQTNCFYLIQSCLKKIKRDLELFSLTHFLQDFWTEIFLLIYSINWPNFIAWLRLLCDILGNMCIVIVCFPDCDLITCLLSLCEILDNMYIVTPFSRRFICKNLNMN